MRKVILSIDGMTCSACSNGLEKYLKRQVGITDVVVNLVMSNASIEYDESILSLEKIEEFVQQAGFQSLGEFSEITFAVKKKQEKYQFIIFTVFAVLLLYISMGHMFHFPIFKVFDPEVSPLGYMILLLILTVCFLIYGFDILKNGYKNLIHRTPNMDTLVGIGVITSFFYSLYNMYLVLRGNAESIMNLYFESTSIVIYFMKLGRYIDGISKDKTKEAIRKLVTITPDMAIMKVDNQERKVTLDEIKKGDILISKAGEKIAVDGEILMGKAHLDESFITGESKPVLKEKGQKVIAGSINYDGYLEYKAEKIGKDSTVSEIVKLVIEASNTKVPIARIADIVSGYFVPIVILIAIMTFLIYFFLGQGVEVAFTTFVTVLVVACPCSLGLATPLAVVVSEGVCISKGILIKKSEVLENARKVSTVVFDKTGTLTYGKLKVSKVISYHDLEKKEILQLIGSLEQKSNHPIAKAFTDYLEENDLPVFSVEHVQNIAGVGLSGIIYHEQILVGNAKILTKFHLKNKYVTDELNLAKEGNSIVYLVKEKEILALVGVRDVIREEAKEVVQTLFQNGIQTIMLTGDHRDTAEKIGKDIGIETIISDVLPQEKANIIQKLKKDNIVMMCGDGINDSPALAIADVGVSINSGTDIARDSADVIFTSNHLVSILDLFQISKKTVRNIKQNLFWAFFYNVCMIPIAIGVLRPFGITLNPMLASLAMVFSSITVVMNALRLKKM